MTQVTGFEMDLTCWYLNQRRVTELVGADRIAAQLSRFSHLRDDEFMLGLARRAAFKDALLQWMREDQPASLGQLCVTEGVLPGTLFTHYDRWYFKNPRPLSKTDDKPEFASAYAKLDQLQAGLKVEFKYDLAHLTSVSARGELSGSRSVLVLGLVKAVTNGVIESTPYVVATPLSRRAAGPEEPATHWGTRMELSIDQIDSFAQVRDVRVARSLEQLEPLKRISEMQIKQAFAQIIGEPIVHKDWGGERSDLFTNRVVLGGRRISTAIAFKGPAKFGPLTMAGLGKNGDQIDRLYTEPADLFIVQHCHEITPPVRGAMRAYAQRVGALRMCCMIDGFDTLRILTAYEKCGFARRRRR